MNYTKSFDEINRDDTSLAGGKGANLGEMSRAGLPVPPGFVLTTAAYDAFVAANDIEDEIVKFASDGKSDDPASFERASEKIHALFSGGEIPREMRDEINDAYGSLGDETPVAVRSSATAEDLAGASFAGQQETFLNVRGEESLLEAVKNCWASLWTARAMAYRTRQGIDPREVSLAVVVQEMVESESAGVMFTANPANGRRDEAVIGAAWGLGESVVSGSVTTDDIVVEKQTGRVLSRETADKSVMTVYTASGVEEREVPEQKRRLPVLDDEAARELARIGGEIEGHYNAPQDVEWAVAGGEFYIVQSRPITALPEPTADPPTDWSVPYPDGLYFRASIVEQMPDPLTPLFADLIDGSVSRSLGRLMEQAFGETLEDDDIRFPTVNGYAYYYYSNSGFSKVLYRSPTVVKKLAGWSSSPESEKFRGGVTGWRERSHPEYVRVVEEWKAKEIPNLPSGELLDGVEELLDAGTTYYTAVQSVIPLAAMGEISFSAFYDRLVRRRGEPPARDLLLGFDSEPIRAEKSLYELAMKASENAEITATLKDHRSEELAKALRDGTTPQGADEARWREWSDGFRRHLELYGHTVYNLDFAASVPADDPAPLFDTLRFYLDGNGNDPRERQRKTAGKRDARTGEVRARLDPARRFVFDKLLLRARRTGPVREDALADMGLAWPVMRRMLRELGRRLVADGVIPEPDDVFWLRRQELQNAVSGAETPDIESEIEDRKMLWRGRRRASAPQLLPETGWMMRLFAPFMPAESDQQEGAEIRGVGASSGRITAPARVMEGPQDFGRMRPGEVLVARITTPAWTSLFSMASAVVTDVGGPLSHSSIVAREYGIPAVLGTGVATRRIESGQEILVDGDAGTVRLLDGADEPSESSEATPDAPASSNKAGKIAAAALAAGAILGLAVWLKRRRRSYSAL